MKWMATKFCLENFTQNGDWKYRCSKYTNNAYFGLYENLLLLLNPKHFFYATNHYHYYIKHVLADLEKRNEELRQSLGHPEHLVAGKKLSSPKLRFYRWES